MSTETSSVDPLTYTLFSRVGVIKSDEQSAIVHPSEVLIEHRSLGVADVQVTRRLGREPRDDLAINCVR